MKRFPNDDEARATVNTALQTAGQRLIRILQPDYVKRGKAADRWARYRDGMLVDDYIDASIAAGDTRGDAVRDLRYNVQHGLIKIYP